MATVIDGKAVAQTIRSEIADEVRLLSQKYGKVSPYFRFIKTEYNKQEIDFPTCKIFAIVCVCVKCCRFQD